MTDGKLITEYVPTNSLIPHPRNVRQGDVGAICESLETHGQYRPIVVQKSTGFILAGNHTWKAATALGYSTIAVTYVDVTDDEALRILLVDNRTNDLAAYDDAALLELLKELAVSESSLEGTGFDGDDVDLLISDLDTPALTGDPDDIPDRAPAVTVPGDVWLLGPHRVLCGDSTNADHVAALMAGKMANLVWTDPPYGVNAVSGDTILTPEKRKAQGGKTIQNDTLDVNELQAFLALAFGNLIGHTNPGAAWYVAAPPGVNSLAFSNVLHHLGVWRQTLVWVKDRLVPGRSDYHYRHEILYYGWTPGAAHHPVADRKQNTVWEVKRPSRSDDHPTMKPLELITKAINNSTNVGALVVDPFAGSGSTLIGAAMTNRVAYVMELNPTYVDVICKRFEQQTGIVPIAESTGRPHSFLEKK